MATHYLRLGSSLKSHAIRHGADKAKNRWAKDVFNDLTESGHVLTTVPLPDDSEGPVLGLYGKRFFGKVRRDNDREDCLLLFRLWPAKTPKEKSSRHRVDVRLLLEPDVDRPMRDSVDTLLSSILNRHSKVDPPPSLSRAAFVEPSQALRAVVRGLELESIRRLCPEASRSIDKVDRGKWRSKLNTLCRRFDRKITDDDRRILKGYRRPNIDIELGRIGRAFDVTFLNSLDDANRQRSLLLELLDLPAGAASTRRTLWLAWLSEQEPGTLKAELHRQAVDGRLAPADSESDSHLDSFLLKTLGEVGRRHQDESLRTLADEATDSDIPWSVVADWAAKLVVGGTDPRHPDSVVDIPKDNGGLKMAIESVEGEPVRGANQAISDTLNESETDTHLAVKIDPPKRPAIPKSERDKLASWAIAQRVSVTELVEGITNPVQNTSQLLGALRDSALDTSSLKGLQDALASLQEATAHTLRLLPTLEEIDPLITEVAELVATLKRVLGRDPLPFLDQEVSLDALREVAYSEPLLSAIRALPDWVVPSLSNGLLENSTDRLLIKCLREDQFRQDIKRLGENLARSDVDPGRLLESVPPPSPGLDAVNYLSDWVDQAIKIATEIASRLRDLTDRVSAEVAKAVTERVAAADKEGRLATLYEEELTLEKIEEVLGEATTVTVRQWNRARIHVSEPVAASPLDAVRAQKKLIISHNFVDREGRRATATYVPYDDSSMPYGFIRVPLTLEALRPLNTVLRLKLKVVSDHGRAWPEGWETPEPGQLEVRSNEWTKVEGDRYQRAFQATIPIRDPSSRDVRETKLRVSAEVYDASDDSLLSEDIPTLEWGQVSPFSGMPELDWSDGVKPDYVKEHPVGEQIQADELLKRLRNGYSFAMVAPRRFGKSTLIDYIAREAEQNKSGEYKLLVLKPLVCTHYPAGGRAAVWKDVHERFIQEIGVGLTTTEPGDIPSTDDIKMVRTSAWKSGYQGIVLLFDEAQLFFAGRDGPTAGDKLKDALEREWTCRPEQGLASVQVGLVGLPSLLDRAGTNLITALRVVESHVLRPEELNRLLLGVSQGQLQTTRAARQELARRAGNNLFVLKTMVQWIQKRLNEEKRLWFNDHDVADAFSEAQESLEYGSERGLAHYLRDSLNEAESVNEWQPKPCYPLAVALARFGRSTKGEKRTELAVQEVQEWCANLPGGEGAYTSYTKERIKEDIEALRELDVYDEGFHSELLEGYLRHVAKIFPGEDDTQVITRCGVERIREPKSLELVAEGGQAKIYRFHKDNTMWAWRQIELSDSRANEVFLVTQEALHKLRDLRFEEGSQYFYDLQQVGISEKGYGVEVYRWTDGVSLDEHVHTFSKEAVVDIGFKIGRAIKLIHDHDILHRDISPRNIILTDDAVPVLVDFGLARAANRKMRTVISGEDAPPEVQSDRPDWTKAADIYGFGITLRKLLKPEKGKSDSLYTLLNLCLLHNPKQRPNAGELLNKLEEIRRQLHVQDIRDKAWQKIEKVAKQSEIDRRFQDLLLKFRPQFEGIAIGLYPRMIERCAEMSVFLDQTLEAFSNSNEDLKLGSIKHKGLRGVTIGQSIDFAHLLRREKSHFLSPERKEQKLREFDTSNDQNMRGLMIEATEQIGQGLHLPQLVRVVETALA